MTDLTNVQNPGYDFGPVHAALTRYVSDNLLSGVSSAVMQGTQLVDVFCSGMADGETQQPLRRDHLFRIFSNTKIITTIAVMQLHERGLLDLDEPVQRWLPQLADRRVLRPGASDVADSEPARSPITARQLLSHSSGLAYGLLDPGTTLFKAYGAAGVSNPATTLAQMMDALAPLPLSYHPGTSWEYSIASDVAGRLVEVISAQRLSDYFQAHILDPLGMADTGFVVPPEQQPRLCAHYSGASLTEPMKPGLRRADLIPYPGAYLQAMPRQSGGGGLVSSLGDMVALMRSLLPGGAALLKPATLQMMMSNQLASGVSIGFPGLGAVPGKVFGLGGSLTVTPSAAEPAAAVGEFQWGGVAGTHWWICPRHNLCGLLMTQRYMSFWHPFSFAFKRQVYCAMGLT